MTITGETLSWILTGIGILAAFAGIVANWTRMKANGAVRAKAIESLKDEFDENIKNQKERDSNQDDEIKENARRNTALDRTLVAMNGKLDNLHTLLTARLPAKKE